LSKAGIGYWVTCRLPGIDSMHDQVQFGTRDSTHGNCGGDEMDMSANDNWTNAARSDSAELPSRLQDRPDVGLFAAQPGSHVNNLGWKRSRIFVHKTRYRDDLFHIRRRRERGHEIAIELCNAAETAEAIS